MCLFIANYDSIWKGAALSAAAAAGSLTHMSRHRGWVSLQLLSSTPTGIGPYIREVIIPVSVLSLLGSMHTFLFQN